MKTIDRKIVTAYVVSSDGRLLLGRKAPGGVYADCWHSPGGGVEIGETDDQALQRELIEETGIDIHAADVRLVDDVGEGVAMKMLPSGEQVIAKMRFVIFKVMLDRPAAEVRVIAAADLRDFRWFPLDELANIKLTPPAKDLFARIGMHWLYNEPT